MVRAATIAVLIAGVALAEPAIARGDALHDLGDAYRAYDAGDLAGARNKLAGLDDRGLAIRDYALWLRGMVWLHSGEPTRAEAAFRQLAKIPGSPFARQVAWRLADCAWDRGDHKAAARAYQKAIAAKDALEVGDVGTAMSRIAEAAGIKTGAAATAYRALAIEHPA
ncbi:MAG TPA: tetratricopeptide repeat protein, partial [Kofleriaceae bacterium]